MSVLSLRLHAFLPASFANGPGRRAVLWTQGCTLGCPGCFNPQTHAARGGQTWRVDEVLERLLSLENIEGVTLSGGEPLQQVRPLLALLEGLRRESSLSVLLFSGYTPAEIFHMPLARRLFDCLDVLIAGRYETSQRLAKGLLGSANKSVHFLTPRYTQEDLDRVPPAEVLVTASGELVFSGIDPLW